MDQLRKEGWSINENQTSEFFPDGVLPKTSNEILKVILDEDLREFGEASIINRKDDNHFEGPCVLQLLRYRNVSVPRIKEEMNQADPTSSIVRLFLTDGHTSISAIVLDSIPGINADTPPGTKILFTGKITVEGIFLVITKKDVKILGGRVEELIEKWNVEKNSVRADGFKAKSAAGKGSGAPKWVSFGKRGQKDAQLEKGFKANNVMPKNIKEGEDADEFAKNREQVLKEIDTDSAKTFAKPNLAPPPPKEKTIPIPKEPKERKPREFKKRGRKNSEDGPDIDVGEYANHKPSGGVTLFDFIGGNAASSDVARLAEETSRIQVTEKKSFDSRGPPGRKPQQGNGPRDQKPARNDQRGNRDQQSFSGPKGTPRQQDRLYDTRKDPSQREHHQNAQNDGKDQRQGNRRTEPAPQQNNSKRGPPQNDGRRGPPQQDQRQDNRRTEQNPRKGPPQNDRQNAQNDGRRGPPQQDQGNRRNEQQKAQTDFKRGPPQQNNPRSGPPQNDGKRGPPFQDHQANQQSNSRRGPPQKDFHPQNAQNDVRKGNFQQGNRAPPQQNYQPNPPNDFRRGPNFQPNFHRGPPPGQQFQPQYQGPHWQVGSQCLATWTDGAIYPATIVDLLPNRMCVVRYNEYGNTHSLPVDFLIMP